MTRGPGVSLVPHVGDTSGAEGLATWKRGTMSGKRRADDWGDGDGSILLY